MFYSIQIANGCSCDGNKIAPQRGKAELLEHRSFTIPKLESYYNSNMNDVE